MIVRAALRLFIIFSLTSLGHAIGTGGNETQTENANPGTIAWQLTNPALNREIEGYASLTSVNVGGSISFFVSTSDSAYSMDFYRIGWYGGAGGRELLGPISFLGVLQPTPSADSYGTFECNWTSAYVLTVPINWTSGVYLVKLTGSSTGKQSYIQFVVREDSRNSIYLFQRSITTDEAYNNWPGPAAGGKSLYTFNSSNSVAAVKVSFNRPYFIDTDPHNHTQVGAGFFLRWEINMVRWMEMNGYDVSYATDIDVHEDVNLLLAHKAFLSVGHDEYWSWQMRANVELARDSGIGLGFFAGNICYWQIRLESSPLSGAADRTQVAYKTNYASDPTANVCYLTDWWRNNSCKPSEQALIGVEYTAANVGCPSTSTCADVVIMDASNWALAGTGLLNGSHIPGILGYEVDGLVEPDSPPGTALIAHSPIPSTADPDAYPAPDYAFSDMVTYTAASGATVFSVGTIQWSWALDDWGGGTQRPSMLNAAAQQITQNALARLVTAAGPPNITNLSPNSGAVGASVTITGTNFGSTQGTSTVKFNGTAGTPTSWSATSIMVPVPTGATTGNVVVTVSGVASNGVPFTVASSTTGYSDYRPITIAHANVPNTDQTNFPVLISGVYSYLATTANGGNVTNANGYDIIFTADAGGTQTLPFERESYNPATGAVNFWVQVPTLSHTIDTVIYMFYGNSLVTTDPSNKTGVWDSNYKAVWHMGEGSGSTAHDSTVSGLSGFLTNTSWTTGEVGTGLGFNGSNSTDNLGSTASALTMTNGYTVSAWVYMPSLSAFSQRIFIKSPISTAPYDEYALSQVGTGAGAAGPRFRFEGNTGGTLHYSDSASNLSPNTWYYVVSAWDGSTMRLYINGSLNASLSGVTGTITKYNNNGQIGYDNTGGGNENFFNGTIDEVRVSSIARSADWIATEYNNETGLTTFYSIGVANGGSSPAISNVLPTSGAVGTSVTVSGTNFGSTQGTSTVKFNGTAGTPTSWSATSIMVPVPTGATTGNVVVTVSGVASNGVTFTVTGP
jgi:hypothetical protein